MMRIREAKQLDTAEVLSPLVTHFGEIRLGGSPRPVRGWVAEDPSGKCVGTAVVRLDGADCWHLWYLGVLPEAQRRGAGGELIAGVEASAREAGANSLRTRTYSRWAGMRRLLEQRGWAFVTAMIGGYHDGVEEEWVLPLRRVSLPVVLVGANPKGRGGELAEAIARLAPLFCLTGVCDRNPEHLKHWERDYPTDSDLERLLDRVPAEAAILALPHSAYRATRQICLQRKLGLFHEKPLACSLLELLELQDQLTRQPTPLVVGVQRRAHPSYVFLKRALQEDRPETLEVRLVLGKQVSDQKSGKEELGWRGDARLAGGGALLDLGYHAIDLVHFLLDVPLTMVSCNLWMGERPALGQELETAATLIGRAGPTWVKLVIDRGGKKHERVIAQGRKLWLADRKEVICNGERTFSCPESWELALRGQLVQLAITAGAAAKPISLWDHLTGLRVVEQARVLAQIQGLGEMEAVSD